MSLLTPIDCSLSFTSFFHLFSHFVLYLQGPRIGQNAVTKCCWNKLKVRGDMELTPKGGGLRQVKHKVNHKVPAFQHLEVIMKQCIT